MRIRVRNTWKQFFKLNFYFILLNLFSIYIIHRLVHALVLLLCSLTLRSLELEQHQQTSDAFSFDIPHREEFRVSSSHMHTFNQSWHHEHHVIIGWKFIRHKFQGPASHECSISCSRSVCVSTRQMANTNGICNHFLGGQFQCTSFAVNKPAFSQVLSTAQKSWRLQHPVFRKDNGFWEWRQAPSWIVSNAGNKLQFLITKGSSELVQ